MNQAFKEGFKSSFILKPRSKIREKVLELSTKQRIRRNWQFVGQDLTTSMDKIDRKLNKEGVK